MTVNWGTYREVKSILKGASTLRWVDTIFSNQNKPIGTSTGLLACYIAWHAWLGRGAGRRTTIEAWVIDGVFRWAVKCCEIVKKWSANLGWVSSIVPFTETHKQYTHIRTTHKHTHTHTHIHFDIHSDNVVCMSVLKGESVCL